MNVRTKGHTLKALPICFIFICTCAVIIEWLAGTQGKDRDTHTHTQIAAKTQHNISITEWHTIHTLHTDR